MRELTLQPTDLYLPTLVAFRRDIHAHPELGMEESRTAGLVAKLLRSWGVEFVEGIGKTGLVATVKGRQNGGRSIGLRADMDALALHEKTALPYASIYPGKMHACGHDGHTTMLLGAARYLHENPNFSGAVHFIFQPAEEGRGGAKAMLEDGLFDRFPCDAVYGLHTMPGIPTGHFATRSGPFFAAACPWHVKIIGSGGHGGAAPHLATDAALALGHFMQAVNTIVSRDLPASDLAVLSIGYIQAGSIASPSVMPNEALVGGTARCFEASVGNRMRDRLLELAHSTAAMFGCTAEVAMEWRTPPVVNSQTQTSLAVKAAAAVVGRSSVEDSFTPLTAGEDFARMLAVRPGAFMLIGNGVDPDKTRGLHSPWFDFNDELIPTGIAYWVSIVQHELNLSRSTATK